MDGRTFNGIQDGKRIDPTFQSEGVSQPWMNSALRQPPGSQVATRSSPQPPQRPYDIGADLPAPGASPAIGQMPQAAPPDLSNANDGGSRAFAMSQGANAPGSAAAFAPAPEGMRTARAEPMPGALGARPQPQPDQAAPRADMPAAGAVPAEGQAPRPAQAITPVPSAEMPRPTNMAEFRDFGMTKQMESANLPHDLRVKILDRGIAMAEKRLGFNQQRADELRGGGFYKSNEARGQGAQPRQQSAPPQAQPQQQRQSVAAPPQAIEFLRANPNARQQFDAKYGQGASASVLGQ